MPYGSSPKVSCFKALSDGQTANVTATDRHRTDTVLNKSHEISPHFKLSSFVLTCDTCFCGFLMRQGQCVEILFVN